MKIKKYTVMLLTFAALLSGCTYKNEAAEPSRTESSSEQSYSAKNEVAEPSKTEGSSEQVFSAYDYYNETSEKIISIESTEDYKGTITASEALSIAEARGFEQEGLTYYFDISGEYVGEIEASEDSGEKAPLYQTTYITENEEVWLIYLIGDAVYAYPISFIYGAELDHEIILSESDSLMSYDDMENKYYTTVPKDSVVELVVVDEINAETLEKYTAEELEKL